MARKSSIEKNNSRIRKVAKFAKKRNAILDEFRSKKTDPSRRFELMLKITSMPRNASKARVVNRCNLTGRPKGVYRKFGLCRNMLRELASQGQLSGVVKASW